MRLHSMSLKCCIAIAGLLAGAVALAEKDASPAAFLHAMHASMKQMDSDMASAPMSGDADRDFAAMMMPHHQGAIEMAKVELLYGRDPVMRRLAQEILIDQQSEIEAMKLWLAKRRTNAPKREP